MCKRSRVFWRMKIAYTFMHMPLYTCSCTDRNTNNSRHTLHIFLLICSHLLTPIKVSQIFIQICQLQVTMPTDGQFKQHMKGSEDALWHPHTAEWPAGKWSLLVRTQSASESTQQVLYLSKPVACVKSHRSYVFTVCSGLWGCKSGICQQNLCWSAEHRHLHGIYACACVYILIHQLQALWSA